MIEDKMTRAERIRLESLAQSMNMSPLVHAQRPTEEDILARAERIEAWLKEATKTEH